jgi:HEAT repeat protein
VFQALLKLGPAAQPLLPDILAAFKKADTYYYCNREGSLAAIDPQGTKAIPGLLGLLGDRKAQVRVTALQHLAPYGMKAREAVPLVTKLCEDKDHFVRSNAERTLAAIQ